MKKSILSLAALLVIAVSLVSCTGGGSPKANAQKFLDGIYHLDVASAKTVSTPETQKQLDSYDQMMSFVQGSARDDAKKTKVDVKEPKITGDNATVDYTVSNDPTNVKTLKMVKQGGDWKASWTKNDAMGGAAGGMNGGGMNSGGTMGGSTAPMDTTMAPGADQNMGGAPTSDTAKMNMK